MTTAQFWNDVRYDIRNWPGNRPIDEDYEPHTFAPTTFAILAAEFADQPRVAALIRRAATPAWCAADAQALIDAIADVFAAAAFAPKVAAFAAETKLLGAKADAVARRAAGNRRRPSSVKARILALAADPKAPRLRDGLYAWVAARAYASSEYVREVLAKAGKKPPARR